MNTPEQKYIAIVSPDKFGPCYGVGYSVDRDRAESEARKDAAVWGFFSHDGIAVEITERQYQRVMAGNPAAWNL